MESNLAHRGWIERAALCKELIQKLIDIVGDELSIVQFILFICGVRPAYEISFQDGKKSETAKIIEKLNLLFGNTDFYVKVMHTAHPSGIAFILCNKKDSYRKTVIGQLPKLLVKQDKKSQQKEDKLVGSLFEYPQCCVKYWISRGPRRPLDSPYKNFIQHQPCKENCKKSLELAKTYAECIKTVFPHLYEKVLKIKESDLNN